ncbi:MAG: hypothetical protein AB7R40_26485 [Nitrospiraceae bacterium]
MKLTVGTILLNAVAIAFGLLAAINAVFMLLLYLVGSDIPVRNLVIAALCVASWGVIAALAEESVWIVLLRLFVYSGGMSGIFVGLLGVRFFLAELGWGDPTIGFWASLALVFVGAIAYTGCLRAQTWLYGCPGEPRS